ncbi:DMT family transporter [Sphingomonas sp. ASV193]|uniref:DMT family transporter n=1 Tax=Sphingomonas sp. ASV193 TaxID=3144405 RepID=UPI0032E8E8B8
MAEGLREMVAPATRSRAARVAFPLLLLGNVALAMGPFLVRHSGVGPVAAGFWRVTLAVPFLILLARLGRQRIVPPTRKLTLTIAAGAFFFGTDVAAWNAGILITKLGNATLFGNIGSFLFAAWGLWLARQRPSLFQALALAGAATGCALLMWGSAELSLAHLHGDLLSALAGLLYAGYLIAVDKARADVPPLGLLALSSVFAALTLLPIALALGEPMIPADWTGVFALALVSQVVGQGLLVFAIGELSPLVVGLALLTQPALSALLGWVYYGESMTGLDFLGAALIGAALVLVRLRPPRAKPR